MSKATRKEREAARRAAQKAAADAWQALVDRHFGYLSTTYGFHLTSADASFVWRTRVIYQSDIAAVAVDRSIEFERVEVSVMRLVDGQLPEYPIFILPDTVINETVFDNILTIRNPPLLEQLHGLRGLDDDHIERSLAFLARTLEETLADFLTGDLSIFDAVDELLKEYARAHPPVITLYLPEDATAAHEAATIAEIEKGSPGIPTVVRRYRQSGSRKRHNPAQDVDASQ